MSKLAKVYIAVMAVFLIAGVIIAAYTRNMEYMYPDGSVINAEYVDALRHNYIVSNGFFIGFWMAAVPAMMVVSMILMTLKGVHMPKWRLVAGAVAMLIAEIIIVCFGFQVIKVAKGEPGAAIEIIEDKKISSGRKGRTEYSFVFEGGSVKVPSNVYDHYNVGDRMVVIRCGGVPLEVQQPEVYTIDPELGQP